MVTMAALGLSGRCLAASAAADAAISGTVRDVHGTPQMGTLVELLGADLSPVASALSDDHGRYIMPDVLPGRYQLRATAAFFVPALRSNLQLHAGAQEIINVTMSALFEADGWLPAQRRRADEPADDWKWALRSTANRPLLRLVDPESGSPISSSATEQANRAMSSGRVTLTNGDGSFGAGGMHQALLLNRSLGDSDGAVLRADVGSPQTLYAAGPSVAVSAGYERRTPMNGTTRLVSTFQSHPELVDGASAASATAQGLNYGESAGRGGPATSLGPGFEVLQLASTQQIALGDAVLIDAGTLMEAERLEATRIEMQPYVRVTARPGSEVVVEYRYATGRQVQSNDDLDHLKPELMVLTTAQGRPLSTRGSHQEVSVSRKLGSGTGLGSRVITFAVFSDRFANGAVAGSGVVSQQTLQSAAMVADPVTGTFHLAAAGYAGRGIGGTLMQPLTPALSAWVEYDLGRALRTALPTDGTPTLAAAVAGAEPLSAQAASFALRGRIVRTGTALKAEYRWQQARTLTAVNAYNASPDEAYLSFFLRQRLWCGRWLPQGVDAVVEATNLLEQGYQPVIGPDGHTLFLAQVPRAVQGGLAFNF